MALSDLVAEKRAVAKEKIFVNMTAEEAQWIRAITLIRKMPANYEDLLREKLRTNPLSVRKHILSRGTAIEVSIGPIEGFDANLYIGENTNKIVKEVRYELWSKNKCYLRDLLSIEL